MVDKERLPVNQAAGIIERAFKKTLKPEFWQTDFDKIYLVGAGAVACIRDIDGVSYMDKLAVAPELQGNGVGKQLLETVIDNHEALVWRSSGARPLEGYYQQYADLIYQGEDWIVYGCNIDEDLFSTMIEVVESIPDSFSE